MTPENKIKFIFVGMFVVMAIGSLGLILLPPYERLTIVAMVFGWAILVCSLLKQLFMPSFETKKENHR